jgi:hypothetical protein
MPATDTARLRKGPAAYCWQPQVKGWTMMVNSIINNFPHGGRLVG